MKTHTEYLVFETRNRMEFLNITDKVEAAVEKSSVTEGLILANSMHITPAGYVNDAEFGLIEDFKDWLEELTPAKPANVAKAKK